MADPTTLPAWAHLKHRCMSAGMLNVCRFCMCVSIHPIYTEEFDSAITRIWPVGAQSGLGPGPGWGPYGPIWALMFFVKNVTFRVQTAPFDKITIDFWRSRRRLYIPDLLKAKKSDVRLSFFKGVVFSSKVFFVSGPDGSVWQNNDWFLQISEASTRFRPYFDQKP